LELFPPYLNSGLSIHDESVGVVGGLIIIGAFVGALVGALAVGAFVGTSVGTSIGAFVGVFVGELVGRLKTLSVGAFVGAIIGTSVGTSIGAFVSAFVGAFVSGLQLPIPNITPHVNGHNLETFIPSCSAFWHLCFPTLKGRFPSHSQFLELFPPYLNSGLSIHDESVGVVGGLIIIGAFVGALVGALAVGAFVGTSVGTSIGAFVGVFVGEFVGRLKILSVGAFVGVFVGTSVGTMIGDVGGGELILIGAFVVALLVGALVVGAFVGVVVVGFGRLVGRLDGSKVASAFAILSPIIMTDAASKW